MTFLWGRGQSSKKIERKIGENSKSLKIWGRGHSLKKIRKNLKSLVLESFGIFLYFSRLSPSPKTKITTE